MSPEDIRNRFDHHPPGDAETVQAHERLRAKCKDLAFTLNDLLPEGREKSLAVTHLEEVLLWGNAAIARR